MHLENREERRGFPQELQSRMHRCSFAQVFLPSMSKRGKGGPFNQINFLIHKPHCAGCEYGGISAGRDRGVRRRVKENRGCATWGMRKEDCVCSQCYSNLSNQTDPVCTCSHPAPGHRACDAQRTARGLIQVRLVGSGRPTDFRGSRHV